MKHYHCPVNGYDCPYFANQKVGDHFETDVCTIEGNPYEECDDFYSVYGDDCEENDYTDYGEDYPETRIEDD